MTVKEKLKKIPGLRKCVHIMRKIKDFPAYIRCVKRMEAPKTWEILNKVFPKSRFYCFYYQQRHRWPHLLYPTNLSEIILSSQMTGKIIKTAPYCDKINVRKFYEEWGLGEHLPKLYGVWNSADEIDFDSLPNQFALKTNHGSGGTIFCRDKANFDFEKARETIRTALSKTYGGWLEPEYAPIPHKAFAEELLLQKANGGGYTVQPFDYKYFCTDGEIRCILLCTGRGTEEGVKFGFYTTDWQHIEGYSQGPHASKEIFPPPPQNALLEMNRIADFIAKKFEHVRVDFFVINNKVYIGELTFGSDSGRIEYGTDKMLLECGHLKIQRTKRSK